MKSLFIALIASAMPALATTSLQERFTQVPSCGGPVAVTQNTFALTTNYRDLHVQVGEMTWQLPGTSQVRDLLIVDETLYVLRNDRIEEWDLTSGERRYETSTLPETSWIPSGGEARGMARWGDQIIIAHGRMGFSVYSMTDHKAVATELLLQDQQPLESEITGVVVDGNEAIFVASSYSLTGDRSKPAFRGFVLWDLSNHLEKHRTIGLDPGSRGLLLRNNLLVVDFGGLYQTFDLKDVRQSNKVRIRRAEWKFPASVRPLAGFDLLGSQIWSCVSRPNADRTRSQIPMIIDTSL